MSNRDYLRLSEIIDDFKGTFVGNQKARWIILTELIVLYPKDGRICDWFVSSFKNHSSRDYLQACKIIMSGDGKNRQIKKERASEISKYVINLSCILYCFRYFLHDSSAIKYSLYLFMR